MKHFKSIIAAAALALATLGAQAQTPKYIFYYIGDGMGMGPVMAAQTYNRVIRGAEQPLLVVQYPPLAPTTPLPAHSTPMCPTAA